MRGILKFSRPLTAFALGAWIVGLATWDSGPAAAKSRRDSRETQSDHRSGDEDFHWSWKLAQGKVIEIKGVNGNIQAEPASGGEVEVTAWKHARKSDPADVKIEVIQHEDGVTICAVYPSRGWDKNECEPGHGGHMNTRNNDVVVDFRVAVPAGVRFVGRTVNGGVEADNLGGPIEAYTVNGGVNVSSDGTVRATTVNGSIKASVGSPEWDGELAFNTVNGGITLNLPSGLNAGVRAQTVNGEISTDFPITVKGKISRRRLSGTVGNGGGDLSLSTVNGSIQLLTAQ